MPDMILDVFDGDAFRNVTLTQRVNETVPFAPGLITQMGLFTGEGIVTLDVAFDEIAGNLRLISTTPRGAPPSQQAHQKGKTRVLRAVHLEREATINADELLAARAYGQVTAQTAAMLVNRRIEGPVGLKTELAYTWEHMYLGAVDGQVYDADNATILYDFFQEFGVVRPGYVTIALSTSTDKTGFIRAFAMALRRTMVKALEGFPLGTAKPVVLCGDNFFDALVTSQEFLAVERTGAFGNSDATEVLGLDIAYSSFQYAGISWINYRGSDDSIVSVPTAEGRAFMTGVPGLFQSFFAPADTFETVSEIGLPMYLLQRPEKQTSSRRVFDLQSNPLPACLRPLHLRRINFS